MLTLRTLVRPAVLSACALSLAFAPVSAQEQNRSVDNGGVHVPGWTGKPDSGMLTDASFAKMGNAFHIVTGPATTYWNSEDVASGNYTVSATFTEPQYMNLNDHPHPYGIMVAGNAMGTDQESYLYCAAYGTGTFIVRGFGPEPFQMNGRRGEANGAVHKAEAKGAKLTQEIAINVTPDAVQCEINGALVASYPRSAVVAPGKLKSLDGTFGIRSAHNTEVMVTDFKMTQH